MMRRVTRINFFRERIPRLGVFLKSLSEDYLGVIAKQSGNAVIVNQVVSKKVSLYLGQYYETTRVEPREHIE